MTATHSRVERPALSEEVGPLIDGYAGLSEWSQRLVESLGTRITDLQTEISDLHKIKDDLTTEINACNKHRGELEERLQVVEKTALRNENYAHENIHFTRNYMHALELDLQNAGIEPEARKSILQSQQTRWDNPALRDGRAKN